MPVPGNFALSLRARGSCQRPAGRPLWHRCTPSSRFGDPPQRPPCDYSENLTRSATRWASIRSITGKATFTISRPSSGEKQRVRASSILRQAVLRLLLGVVRKVTSWVPRLAQSVGMGMLGVGAPVATPPLLVRVDQYRGSLPPRRALRVRIVRLFADVVVVRWRLAVAARLWNPHAGRPLSWMVGPHRVRDDVVDLALVDGRSRSGGSTSGRAAAPPPRGAGNGGASRPHR